MNGTANKLRELAESIDHYDEIRDPAERASWLACVAVELRAEARKLDPEGPEPEYERPRWKGFRR